MSSQALEILEYPDARLTRACAPVDLEHLEGLQGFIDDLIYTMFVSGGVGLAAPQVGHSIQMFVLDQRPINGDERAEPWVFINPRIEPLTGTVARRREGCLSFPGVFIYAKRPEWVRITANDRHGEEFSMDTTGNGLLSQAVQHENDHLQGVLMSDYADKRGLKAIKAWARERSVP